MAKNCARLCCGNCSGVWRVKSQAGVREKQVHCEDVQQEHASAARAGYVHWRIEGGRVVLEPLFPAAVLARDVIEPFAEIETVLHGLLGERSAQLGGFFIHSAGQLLLVGGKPLGH
jgi:hypothetical protein